jgi:recombination protein RecR
LDKEPEKKIRVGSLIKLIENESSAINEVIFALSATSDGEDTAMYLEEKLKDIAERKKIKLSRLGRGLSTGTELEYVDKETMTHALKGRNAY